VFRVAVCPSSIKDARFLKVKNETTTLLTDQAGETVPKIGSV
jgi:hypothetical protein